MGIVLLDENTINKIAAGEVVERPAAVVKELVENAIDAGSSAVTIEIKEGGISFIRITDNGCGIPKEEIRLAFERHSTSKIRSAEDLFHISSLGFRGEALASIAAVAQVELVTKTKGSLTGNRFVIDGGQEKSLEEIGCPDGTTFLVRNLFFNTPARRKFLKSAMTEAGYVNDLVERLAISHPEVSFKFINNNQIKLQTSGNSNCKENIYHVYGRDIAGQLLELNTEKNGLRLTGYIGKPIISRGNRNYMNYFINGRYIKSAIINKAIEEAYKPYSMTHRYPFTSIILELDPARIDVNVHPTKMEIRISNQEEVFQFVYDAISEALSRRELIPEVVIGTEKKEKPTILKKEITKAPEPFELKRRQETVPLPLPSIVREEEAILPVLSEVIKPAVLTEPPVQMDLFEEQLLSREAVKEHRIIGQLFKTYWIIEYRDKMFLVDQHAAHEKVLFERTMAALKIKEMTSQLLNPPLIISFTMREEAALKEHLTVLERLGFEIEHFGGKEYSVRAVPADLYGIAARELLLELIDSLVEEDGKKNPELILEKVASMSCKAAVKGNQQLSEAEARALIDELMTLENPYHCPHGRPVIVSMTKQEIEKKFKRIV
ncbi:MAG: DNA mismatch repair endonuclease MutL [Acetivibrio ethanolgignens]